MDGHLLFNFTPEILDLILGYADSSHHLIVLWKCGNSILNVKLAKGITYLNLSANPRLPTPLPNVVFHLRSLRSFTLQCTENTIGKHSSWSNALEALPERLEALHIQSARDLPSFCDIPTIASVTAGPTNRLEPSQPEQAPMSIIKRRFTSLKTLQVRITQFSLSSLPSSLTHLIDIEIVCSLYNAPIISILPRALRYLDGTVQIGFSPDDSLNASIYQDWTGSPPQLAYIRSIKWINGPSNMAWLPRSLKRGQIQGIGDASWTPLKARTVPPRLENLTITELTRSFFEEEGLDWVAELPHELIELSFVNQGSRSIYPIVISANQLALLPRTLTSLNLSTRAEIDWHSLREAHEISSSEFYPRDLSTAVNTSDLDETHVVEAHKVEIAPKFDLWPPKLAFLSVAIESNVAGTAHLLPATLTSLKLSTKNLRGKFAYYIASRVVEVSVGELSHCRSLSKLFLEIAARDTDCMAFKGELPPSITLLAVSGAEGLDRSSFENLPDSITQLSALLFQGDQAGVNEAYWKLPAMIRTLKVNRWRGEWFSSIPRSLRTFITSSLHGSKFPFSGEVRDYFQELPPQLEVLVFTSSKVDPKWSTSNDSFSTLKRLVKLFIPKDLVFPSKILRNLPRTLTTITLNLAGIDSEDAPFLPPLLTNAYFGARVPWKAPYIARYWPVRSVDTIPKLMEDVREEVRKRAFKLTQ